jgi:hypothetical protein
VPGLRILLRIAPILVGALAAAVWLRRRRIERIRLPAPPARPVLEPPPGPVAAKPPETPPGSAAHEPVSIVRIVDDLLEIGR